MPRSKQHKGAGAQDGLGLYPHVLATLTSINPEAQRLPALAFVFLPLSV